MDKYLDLFVNIQIEIFSKKVPLLNRMKEKYKKRIEESDLFEEKPKFDVELAHIYVKRANMWTKENGR